MFLRSLVRLFFRGSDEYLPVGPVPSRYLMPPPELAGYAPGLYMLKPFEVRALPVFRYESDPPFLDCRNGGRCESRRIHVPLVGEPGLDHDARPVSVGDGVPRIFCLIQKPMRFHVLYHALSRLEPVEPPVFRGDVVVKASGPVEYVYHREAVSPPDLEVVEIVGGRDLDSPGTLLRVAVFIGDYRYGAFCEGEHRILSDEVFISRVFGVHRDGRVAEHGFGPRGGDGYEFVTTPLDRVFEVPEMPRDLPLIDFEIGDRRAQLRVPVDEPLVLVDELLAVEVDEDLPHRIGQPLVHREVLHIPIGERPQAP